MKKIISLILALAMCLSLCACGSTQSSNAAAESTSQSALTQEPTEPEPTEPELEMIAGVSVQDGKSSKVEGRALSIENVSIGFSDTLSEKFTSTTRYTNNTDQYALNDSQVFAVVQFTVTNQTKEDIQLIDSKGNFVIQIDYDNGYQYSTYGETYSHLFRTDIFGDGGYGSVRKGGTTKSNNGIGVSPLASVDVTAYIPCAKVVAENPDKPLSVTFVSKFSGTESLGFVFGDVDAAQASAQSKWEIGPDSREGNAVAVSDVSVTFVDELPSSIKSSTTYSVCGFKEELDLNESQVYAAINFKVTSKIAEEIKLSDIRGDFLVELIYDRLYVFSTDGESWCVVQSGSEVAVMSSGSSIGKVVLSPLSTKDVTFYIPCAKDVSTNLEKNLMVVFTTNYGGQENLDFVIR